MMIYFQAICPADDGIIEKPIWVYSFLTIGKWNMCHGNFVKHFWMKIYKFLCVSEHFNRVVGDVKKQKKNSDKTSSRIRTIFRHLLKSFFTRENNYKTNTLTMKITNTFKEHESALSPHIESSIVPSRDQHKNKVQDKQRGYELGFNTSIHVTSLSKF